jgi:hypothetical protein
MKKQRMKHCFFALTLCCTAGSMYGQVAQDSSKTIEKKSSVNGKKIQKSKFSDDSIELNNVVVTALGIKREEKVSDMLPKPYLVLKLRQRCLPTGLKLCRDRWQV